jgi:hypothetical protein
MSGGAYRAWPHDPFMKVTYGLARGLLDEEQDGLKMLYEALSEPQPTGPHRFLAQNSQTKVDIWLAISRVHEAHKEFAEAFAAAKMALDLEPTSPAARGAVKRLGG